MATKSTKVVVITPNYDPEESGGYTFQELLQLPKDELLSWAKNFDNEEVEVYYTLEDFQLAFNSELISDQGYIIFI